MMDYNGFKFICNVAEGIPGDILDVCRPFVMKEMSQWDMTQRSKTAEFDFGFSKLGDITDKAKSIKRIKASIIQGTIDFDKLGRSITKMRYKQLLKNPNKGLMRIVLKSYYLHSMNLSKPELSNNTIDDLWFNAELRI